MILRRRTLFFAVCPVMDDERVNLGQTAAFIPLSCTLYLELCMDGRFLQIEVAIKVRDVAVECGDNRRNNTSSSLHIGWKSRHLPIFSYKIRSLRLTPAPNKKMMSRKRFETVFFPRRDFTIVRCGERIDLCLLSHATTHRPKAFSKRWAGYQKDWIVCNYHTKRWWFCI